jgi:hypothetical protein
VVLLLMQTMILTTTAQISAHHSFSPSSSFSSYIASTSTDTDTIATTAAVQ